MDLSQVLRRGNGSARSGLGRHTVGNALVVHLPNGMTEEAQALALGVAPDTEHDLVVLDLPVDLPVSIWESVAEVLPRRRRGVRLVIGGRSREGTALAGQWLAERINRPVLAPDGVVFPSAGGALFVHSGQSSGWVRFQPGRPSAWDSKRFPRPAWDSRQTAETTVTSSTGVAEPLPGGFWIRPTGGDTVANQHRRALITAMPTQHETMTIVLGCPGLPALSLDDVARLWMKLPADVRANARFVQYGPVSADGPYGQALADLLAERTGVYTGLPIGSPDAPVIRTVLPDGSPGWYPSAREIGYRPRESPELRGYRAPIDGLNEIAPAVYWYAPDAVIEVVQSGLLVRPPQDGPNTPAVRALTIDPSLHTLAYDPAVDADEPRMLLLAQDVLARLDQRTRQMSRVLPAAALLHARAQVRPVERTVAMRVIPPALPAAEPQAPVPEVIESVDAHDAPQEIPPAGIPPVEIPVGVAPTDVKQVLEQPKAMTVAARLNPTPAVARLRVQSTPGADATALLPARGVEKEREWLRRSLGAEFGVRSNAVARILSQHPGFQGALSTSSAQVLTDAVAVQLYLSASGASIDHELRTGANGPHVPLARCVVSGLSRLPSHRGTATFATTLPPEAWKLLVSRPALTEWGFLNTLTRQSSTLDGDVEVLVWSITGRRTKLLEPAEGGVDNRVVFVPGTSFKVLRAQQPSAAARGVVLLRELTTGEVDDDGRVATDRVALDELATTALDRELERWAGQDPAGSELDDRAAGRFGAFPGLV
ncbi:hypothetical protein [Kutzneria chonburiensis]|uniref:ADP ribosyltransferase domain-containing protein n=1 Tax=Kutzneria chonburiensis TaxID=1483604 RepID=A0ABV6N5N0_9PSEU|nr:hypothetical protein [Kutzneria chonburiensis]